MKRFRSFTIVVLAIIVLACSVYAGDMECLGGWEGDNHGHGYGYIGVGRSISIKSRAALVTRLTGSYLYYGFDHADSTTQVGSPGVSLLAGISFVFMGATVIVLSGPELRWNRDDIRIAGEGSATSQREKELSAVLQGFVYTPLADKTSLLLLANYDGANHYVFSRLSLIQVLAITTFGKFRAPSIGLEGTAQGNDDITSVQAGIFIEISHVLGELSFRLSGGAKKTWSPDSSGENGAYAGAGFYTHF